LALIALAHGRTSLYDISDIGATSPALWHMAHFSYKIGAMSFPNEGTDFWAKTVAGSRAPAKIQRNGMWDRIIVFLLNLERESRTDLEEPGLLDSFPVTENAAGHCLPLA
jgi:hypothetical protein